MPDSRIYLPRVDMNGLTPAYQVTGLSYPPAGHTENFQFFNKASLGATGSAIAAGLKAQCEHSLTLLRGWFSIPIPNLPFKVYVTDEVDGAMHYGCADTEIYVGSINGTAPASNVYSLLLAAEVAEVLEAAVVFGWNCGYSN